MEKKSIVITVFNEAGSLAELIRRIVQTCDLFEPYEIICVDDGSDDASFDILCKLKLQHPQLKIIKFSTNAGQSAALAAGIKAAQGDIIVTLDADLQNPPEAIPLFLDHIKAVDAVVGWRENRRDPLIKRVGSFFANMIRRWILRDSFHDNGCAFRAFRRRVADDLLMFKSAAVFFPNLIQFTGCSFCEIRIPHEPRKYGRSKNKTLSFSGVSAFFDCLFLRAYKKRRVLYKINQVIS